MNSWKELRENDIAKQTVTWVYNVILMKLEIGSCKAIKFVLKTSDFNAVSCDKNERADVTRTDSGRVTTDNVVVNLFLIRIYNNTIAS